ERPRTRRTPALGANGHGRPQGGPACARACRCNRAKQSYLVIEIFVGASLLPTPDRMGEALRLTIGLDPGPMMARPAPVRRRERSKTASSRAAILRPNVRANFCVTF